MSSFKGNLPNPGPGFLREHNSHALITQDLYVFSLTRQVKPFLYAFNCAISSKVSSYANTV
jgi:hypothetical protein